MQRDHCLDAEIVSCAARLQLAYFFTEHADAAAFLRAVRENTGADLPATIIGVSLADIIKAYSSEEAKAAQETFVLIPTMAEVAAARQLMRAQGKPEPDAASLGPGNGLIPVFWSEALAVQSAGGKQRKVLFLKLGDLQAMWKNLADARKEAGELDELPDGPTVQVSDLQTMAGLLVSANKTADIMFLPSSTALKHARGQSRARSGVPPGMAADDGAEDGASSMRPLGEASPADADGADGLADGVDDFEGEEEEAI